MSIDEAIALLKDRIPKALYALEIPSRNPYDAYPELKDAERAIAALSTIDPEVISALKDTEIARLRADREELKTYFEEILKLIASLGTAFSWMQLASFKDATAKIASAAILGAEPAKEDTPCPNDSPQDKEPEPPQGTLLADPAPEDGILYLTLVGRSGNLYSYDWEKGWEKK